MFGAIAAAIALIGPIGIVIVLAALLAGTATIVSISRRTAVTRHNVNESRDVTVQFGRVATPPVMAAAGAVASPAIAPIIIRQPTLTPPTNDTTTTGPQT